MTASDKEIATRIRDLNDAFRRSFVGGIVMITAGVEAMPLDQRRSLLHAVRSFETFNEDNDPIASTTLARSTCVARSIFGRSTITIVTQSTARRIPLITKSPGAF